SANDLINNTLPKTLLPDPGFTIHPSEYKTGITNSVMFTKMHNPTSSDFPMLVTMQPAPTGATLNNILYNNVLVYNIWPTDADYLAAAQSTPQSPALWDLSPWMSSLALSPPAITPVPASMIQQFDAHPVWSAASTGPGGPGSLYWSFVNGGKGISV